MRLITRLSTTVGTVGLVAMLVAALTTSLAGADQVARERRAAVKTVTLTANRSDVVAGSRMVLSGRIKAARRGARVIIQKKIGSKRWRLESITRTTARAPSGTWTTRTCPAPVLPSGGA